MWQLIINEWKYNYWKWALLSLFFMGLIFYYGELGIGVAAGTVGWLMGAISYFKKEKRMQFMSAVPISVKISAIFRLYNILWLMMLISVESIIILCIAPEIVKLNEVLVVVFYYSICGLLWYIFEDITNRKNYYLLISLLIKSIPLIVVTVIFFINPGDLNIEQIIMICLPVIALLSLLSIKTFALRSSYLS